MYQKQMTIERSYTLDYVSNRGKHAQQLLGKARPKDDTARLRTNHFAPITLHQSHSTDHKTRARTQPTQVSQRNSFSATRLAKQSTILHSTKRRADRTKGVRRH